MLFKYLFQPTYPNRLPRAFHHPRTTCVVAKKFSRMKSLLLIRPTGEAILSLGHLFRPTDTWTQLEAGRRAKRVREAHSDRMATASSNYAHSLSLTHTHALAHTPRLSSLFISPPYWPRQYFYPRLFTPLSANRVAPYPPSLSSSSSILLFL